MTFKACKDDQYIQGDTKKYGRQRDHSLHCKIFSTHYDEMKRYKKFANTLTLRDLRTWLNAYYPAYGQSARNVWESQIIMRKSGMY